MKPYKFKFATAVTAKEAENKFDNFQPDLVLLDLRLPDKDGLEVAQKIRKEDKTTKILLMTGYSSMATREKMFATGIDDYLIKPFEMNEFINKVTKLL